MNRPKAITVYFVAIAVIVVADLWSKAYFFDMLQAVIQSVDGSPAIVSYVPRVVIPQWFELEPALNPGAFSGWFSGLSWLLVGVSVLAVVATTSMVVLPARSRGVFVLALGLVAGGALGNMYDRLLIGAVRDFLKVFYVKSNGSLAVWPNFNIADSAICVGVGLILLVEFFGRKEKPQPEPAPAAAK